MNLFTWDLMTEDEVKFFHVGRRSWRKALEAFIWQLDGKFYGFGLAINTEMSAEHDVLTWRVVGQTSMTLSCRWAWGFEHMYYDGPHCMFSLGFLHFNWEPEWCDGCWLDGHDELPACRAGKCEVKQ